MCHKYLCFIFLLFLIRAQDFSEFKLNLEMKLINLATEMSTLYTNRCDSDVTACYTKSYEQCTGSDQKIVYQDFPKPFGCLAEGAYMSQLSSVRLLGGTSIQDVSDEGQRFICSSALMEKSFKKLNENRNRRYGSAYIGTIHGITRIYPSSTQCLSYDPRFRPWYIAATSGGKNIILAIDVSTSMNRGGKNLALKACKSVINTLSNNDFIGVVVFSQNASSLVSDQITRATLQHKQQLIRALDGLTLTGGTNYQAAFKKSFEMLASAKSDEFGSPCQNSSSLILFMSDGYPGVGQITSDGLINIIQNRNKFDTKIFTYGLGSYVSQSILQKISCANDGIMFKAGSDIDDNSLTDLVMQYHLYLSKGIYVTKPTWTEPYEDFNGFGSLVTVSMPIYYTQNSERYILGVAGIDVSMDSLKQFGIDTDEQITKQLLSDPVCQKTDLTDCQIEQMRPNYSTCGVSSCTSLDVSLSCSDFITSDIFIESINSSGDLCNGLSVGDVVGITISSIIFLHIVLGIIAVCYKVVYKK